MARSAGSPRWNDPGLLLLASLSSGPKHGYAMTQDIEQSFGVTLGPGTLYSALARLEERGFVGPMAGDERRRPYRLTGEGVRLLADQADEMRRFADLAHARIRPNASVPTPGAHG